MFIVVVNQSIMAPYSVQFIQKLKVLTGSSEIPPQLWWWFLICIIMTSYAGLRSFTTWKVCQLAEGYMSSGISRVKGWIHSCIFTMCRVISNPVNCLWNCSYKCEETTDLLYLCLFAVIKFFRYHLLLQKSQWSILQSCTITDWRAWTNN